LFPRAFRWIGRMNAPIQITRARVIMAIALGVELVSLDDADALWLSASWGF